MRPARGASMLIGLLGLPGCLSLSVGDGTHQPATMAQEITALQKLRDRGTITSQEFETGKLTLLQTYRLPEPNLINPAETQFAETPAPSEALLR